MRMKQGNGVMRLALVAASLIIMAVAVPVAAQTKTYQLDPARKAGRVQVTVGQSQTIEVDQPFGEVTIGNPDTADLIPMTDHSIYVLGRQPGTTNLSVYDGSKRLAGVIDIEVTYDLAGLREALRIAVPGSNITVRSLNGRLMLSGAVPDAPSMNRALEIAGNFAGTPITNALTVASSQQVMLEVRILEVSRDAGRELGVNLAASKNGVLRGVTGGTAVPVVKGASGQLTGVFSPFLASGSPAFGTFIGNLLSAGGWSVDTVVQALETRGLGRRLAEPNLVALSGDTANFLAGGEIPLPVPGDANSAPSIDYKPFGVQLAFTPTVLQGGLVNLKIQPSVSEVDYGRTQQIGTLTYPTFTTRSASTTVELRDGQGFAIAGLLQSVDSKTLSQVPWIGNVPVLGALFHSSSFQKSESELVILVTPRLVRPVPPGVALASPLDNRLPTNDPQFFTTGQMEIPAKLADTAALGPAQAPYGHILNIKAETSGAVYKR